MRSDMLSTHPTSSTEFAPEPDPLSPAAPFKGGNPGSGAGWRGVHARVASALTSGALSEGDRLPTIEILAHDAGVSKQTVIRALSELRRSGLIERRQGVGTFVALKGARNRPHFHIDTHLPLTQELTLEPTPRTRHSRWQLTQHHDGVPVAMLTIKADGWTSKWKVHSGADWDQVLGPALQPGWTRTIDLCVRGQASPLCGAELRITSTTTDIFSGGTVTCVAQLSALYFTASATTDTESANTSGHWL